jgi:hypothetical protein
MINSDGSARTRRLFFAHPIFIGKPAQNCLGHPTRALFAVSIAAADQAFAGIGLLPLEFDAVDNGRISDGSGPTSARTRSTRSSEIAFAWLD